MQSMYVQFDGQKINFLLIKIQLYSYVYLQRYVTSLQLGIFVILTQFSLLNNFFKDIGKNK